MSNQYKASEDCTVALHMFSLFLTHRAFLRPESQIWDKWRETSLQVQHCKRQTVFLSHECPYYDCVYFSYFC